MVLLAIPPSELPSTTESSAFVIGLEVAAARATSSGDVVSADPFVEAPIEFVPGLEAHPSREAQPEPSGSGPFGF